MDNVTKPTAVEPPNLVDFWSSERDLATVSSNGVGHEGAATTLPDGAMILDVRLDAKASPVEVALKSARVRNVDGVVCGEVNEEAPLLAIEQQD